MQKILAFKKAILFIFCVLAVISAFLLGNLKFSFDFNQFFPEGDDDLIFYEKFIEEFGTDDNFLLIAVENKETVFKQDFLQKFDKLSIASKKLPYVTENNSLTTLSYPLKTSFGYTKLSIIHIDAPDKYEADWHKIQEDDLFINSLIDKKASSLVLALETEDNLNYEQSVELLTKVRALLQAHNLKNYHLLGRTFFYEAIVQMQKRELMVTSLISILLVFIVLLLIYRRIAVVLISLVSITIALLIFLGTVSLFGKELNAMAAFYPILMLIVGTSDVIHIMDNFIGRLQSGVDKNTAIVNTLKEIGLATLLTSITTAIGFASLLFSRLESIQIFGVNAAVGVVIAYITIIFFTSALLALVKKEHLLPKKSTLGFWSTKLSKVNRYTIARPHTILWSALVFTIICLWGLSNINTNYKFENSLPENSKIAEDFSFFQKHYAGFRPLEVAVLAKKGHLITDFKIAKEIEKMVQRLKASEKIQNVQSVNLIYKTINKANHLNRADHFVLPKDEKLFNKYRSEAKKIARKQFEKFIGASGNTTRITTRVLDIGTDSLNQIYKNLNTFIATKTDTSIVNFRLTGKGLLLDKNAVYVQNSLLQGLLMGLILVGALMALIFKNLKLVIISLVPNVLPLLFAGALLGFLGIPLEATVSIVFAIVFGIAVDDTIHFLGKYKICISKGLNQEEALEKTFLETGRALVITTLVLFFGFMVLIFSIHTPSVTIGLLISATLLTALILDLLLLPVLLRKWLRH